MPPKKKKRSCPFSSGTARRRKPKKSFSSDWAENLAESIKLRALTSPHQHLVQGDQKFPKITVEEPLEDPSGKRKHWNMAKAPAGEDQQIRDLSLLSRKRWTCAKCMNLGPLGCLTIAVRRTKLILHFRRRKKSRAFAINRASVLGFRAIGGGHATTSKVFSFLGLYTWNDNFELTNLW